MLGDKRLSQLAFLAKYALVYLDVTLFGDPSKLALQPSYLGIPIFHD